MEDDRGHDDREHGGLDQVAAGIARIAQTRPGQTGDRGRDDAAWANPAHEQTLSP